MPNGIIAKKDKSGFSSPSTSEQVLCKKLGNKSHYSKGADGTVTVVEKRIYNLQFEPTVQVDKLDGKLIVDTRAVKDVFGKVMYYRTEVV